MSPSNHQNNLLFDSGTPGKVPPNELPFKLFTRPTSYATTALGYSRICLVLDCLLAPNFACNLFKFAISNETATVVRLFGVRGIALGELLVTAEDRKELRRLLHANVACDVIDVFSLAAAIIFGNMEWLPGGMLIGGGVVCAGVGLLGLK